MIIYKFSPKNFCPKIGVFCAQNKDKLYKKWIITLVFGKNANVFAENWQKSQKIVIITSTLGQSAGHFSPIKRISDDDEYYNFKKFHSC
jgi:hypothetical protein